MFLIYSVEEESLFKEREKNVSMMGEDFQSLELCAHLHSCPRFAQGKKIQVSSTQQSTFKFVRISTNNKSALAG